MNDHGAAFCPESAEDMFGQAVMEYMEAKRSGTADRKDFQDRFAAVANDLGAFFAAEDSVEAALTPPSTLKSGATADATPAAKPVPFGKYQERQKARLDAFLRLRGELKNKKGLVDSATTISKVYRFLVYLQTCPDFAAIRDAAALAKLLEDEKKDWTLFWADVEALQEKLDAPVPKK
jgi:hypothetical protein